MASLNTDLCIAHQREAVNLLVKSNNKMLVPLVILLATSSLPLVMLQFEGKYYLHFYYQYVHIDINLYANLNDIR